MMTLTLTPELEDALTAHARQRGTTPELLALDTLRQQFAPAPPPTGPAEGETMLDFFRGYIGCIDSREHVPGGAQMSIDTGKKFTALLLKKRREGRL